jgi:hypothetical protein
MLNLRIFVNNPAMYGVIRNKTGTVVGVSYLLTMIQPEIKDKNYI